MRRAQRRKFHFIYKTTCVITGRYYVGMHSTDDMDDGYLGSGRFIVNSVRKHGKENHRREVLELLPTREELRVREGQIVNADLLSDDSCMNLNLGGLTGDLKDPTSAREKMRRAKLGKHFPELSRAKKGKTTWMKGKRHTPEAIEKIKKNHVGMLGKTHSEETRRKMSEAIRVALARKKMTHEVAQEDPGQVDKPAQGGR